MRIATYNINGINGRLETLVAYLEAHAPDAVCLQELKTSDASFPHAALRKVGYHAVVRGQRAMHGVAILARGAAPIVTRRELPGDPHDAQARYLEAAVGGVLLACIYAPNGNPQPGPKFDYKLAWLDRLHSHASMLHASGHAVALVGDFNVVPTDLDIYDPHSSWRKDALLQPQSRAAFARLREQGWIDVVRALHPAERIYTFWDYKRNAWSRNAGLRLDHFLVTGALMKRVRAVGVDRDARAQAHASDHAPLWLELG
jgi:exodeoxyribonuclease-3